jgi:uncharacterized protein (DUF1778 family)
VVAKEQKTAVISVRVKPSVKTMVEKLAEADGRSLASFIERLIEAADGASQGDKKA